VPRVRGLGFRVQEGSGYRLEEEFGFRVKV
jgi:hypothetical protein